MKRTIYGSSAAATVASAEAVALRPTAALAATYPRATWSASSAVLISGRMHMTAVYLLAGKVINSITYVSATGAAATPTNQWFALYDSALALLRQTTDDLTTAWAANTPKTLALSSPFTTTYSGLYYLGIMVAAATVPTLAATSQVAAVAGIAPAVNGWTLPGGLTTTPPNPAAAITPGTGYPWAYVS